MECLRNPSHWRAATPHCRDWAEYTQHPSSTTGTRRYQYQLLCATAGHREASLLTERSNASLGTALLPRLPCLTHRDKSAAWAPLSWAKLWINMWGVIPSAWGYPQKLARLIIILIISRGGSLCDFLSVPVSEGRGAPFQNWVSSFCWPSTDVQFQ